MRHRKRSAAGRFFLRLLLFAVLFPFCAVLFMGFYACSLEDWKSFDPASLSDMEETLIIYDRDRKEYLRLNGGEDRRVIDAAKLPENIKNAFLATEDNRFYEHNGIDIVRMFGAVINDIKSGSLKEGASTISQQLVKTAALSGDKTVSRKLSEIIMAFKTEQAYSKDEILSLYLNRVYFGSGKYGIEAASLGFFGKHADELTVAEAASLAAALKSPSRYSPADAENNRQRRDIVLKKMFEDGYITKSEFLKAVNSEITTVGGSGDYPYGFFTDAVLNEAANALGISIDGLLKGGYSIYTSLDTEKQSYIEELMADDSLFPSPADDGEKPEAAAVLIDPSNYQICALTGGRSHNARLCFSRASDMRRQPGSAIKPVLVFAPAIEYKDYSTTSFLLDQPMKFGDYVPRNSGSGFKGWITLRDTVAYSVNIPAVEIFEDIGVEKAKKYAESVGIRFDARDNNLSLALGGFTNGITPLELAAAYQPFANGGSYAAPSTIRYITDSSGNTVYSAEKRQAYSVLSPASAFLTASMLSSSVEYGTAKNLSCEGIPLSAKTGTTKYDDASNNKDAWIAAFNSEYILTVWMGFDKTDNEHSLKKGETGGSFPALFAKKVFEHIYENSTAPTLEAPDDVVGVVIDKNALSQILEVVPAMADSNAAVTEYYKKSSAPRTYENDDMKSRRGGFAYYYTQGI